MAKRDMKRSNTRSNPRQQQDKRRPRKDNVIKLDIPSNQPHRSKEVNILPKNVKQEELILSLANPKKFVVFATGPAGTGKTHVATTMAIKALKAGEIKKIVITRPNVAVDDTDIGFLPGDIVAKMTPWMLAVLDVFYEYFSKQDVVNMIEDGIIEIIPIAFIRGRTLPNAFIILDEAQNTTPSSMLSVLTRIGDGSKLVITGDIKQSDRSKDKNGLIDFMTRFQERNSAMIDVIEFETKDVQRHPVIKEILDMYKDLE